MADASVAEDKKLQRAAEELPLLQPEPRLAMPVIPSSTRSTLTQNTAKSQPRVCLTFLYAGFMVIGRPSPHSHAEVTEVTEEEEERRRRADKAVSLIAKGELSRATQLLQRHDIAPSSHHGPHSPKP